MTSLSAFDRTAHYPRPPSESRHLQWAFSRRSCADFLCLYFDLQALLFVKWTSSISPLVEAAGLVLKGNASAGLTRKVVTDKITIERTIYGSPHMTGDALRRSPSSSGRKLIHINAISLAGRHRRLAPPNLRPGGAIAPHRQIKPNQCQTLATDVRYRGRTGLVGCSAESTRLTRKRHAVSRDDICRVQERFSVIELCLLKLGCWPVLGPSGLF